MGHFVKNCPVNKYNDRLACHIVKGPITVLKEARESGESQDTSMIAYIIQIREQLQEMMGLIQQNM